MKPDLLISLPLEGDILNAGPCVEVKICRKLLPGLKYLHFVESVDRWLVRPHKPDDLRLGSKHEVVMILEGLNILIVDIFSILEDTPTSLWHSILDLCPSLGKLVLLGSF